jgi:hypothetical protein
MKGPFAADMESLALALSDGDHAEVEFSAHRVYLAAKALGRTEVANAAANVVAAYRIVGAEAARGGVLYRLACLTNCALPD